MVRYGLLTPAGLGFVLWEQPHGSWILREDTGREREATSTEVALWERLLAEREEVHASRMQAQRLTEAMTDVLATVASLLEEVEFLRHVIGPVPKNE